MTDSQNKAQPDQASESTAEPASVLAEPTSSSESTAATTPDAGEERQSTMDDAKQKVKKEMPKLLKRLGRVMLILTVIGCLFMIFAAYMVTTAFKTVLEKGLPGASQY